MKPASKSPRISLAYHASARAQSFEDAEVFFTYTRSHAVPLAVLDVWMPETSGLRVQARLREVSPDTKVIVITGRETPAIRAAALEGGAFAFLAKPFDDEVFLSLVARALRSAEIEEKMKLQESD